MKCSSCDTANPDNNKFCMQCGRPLKDDKQTPVVLPIESVSPLEEVTVGTGKNIANTEESHPIREEESAQTASAANVEQERTQIASVASVEQEKTQIATPTIPESTSQQEPTIKRPQADVSSTIPVVDTVPPDSTAQPDAPAIAGIYQVPIPNQMPPMYPGTPSYPGYPMPGGTYPSAPDYPGYLPVQPPNVSQAGMSGQYPPMNYQPGMSGQYPPMNAYQPGMSEQYPVMNAYQPGVSGQYPPINAYQPGMSGQYLPINQYPQQADGVLPSRYGQKQSRRLLPSGAAPIVARVVRSRRLITLALIALVLLLVVSSFLVFLVSYLNTILPASAATVTITPTSKNFRNIYAVSAVTGPPDASQHQVGARFLSFTTKDATKTVQATGQGTEGVTEATGTLIFSNSTANFTIFAQTFADNSGVGLVIDTNFNIFVGQTVAIVAHAAKAGSIGNVPTDDVNGTFNVGSGLGTIHVENTSPFTGGTDQTYSFVQQSDIDTATASLQQDQLRSAAQTGLQELMHAGEQFVVDPNSGAGNGIQCTPNITADHKVNDRATNVTVTESVTCKGEVYDLQAAQAMTVNLLKYDAASQLGASYALVGNVVTGVPIIVTTDQGGTVSMNVDAQGVWAFQFSNNQKQQMAKLIAGKTQADATPLLLKQEGVLKASIRTSGGWGSALPTSPRDIKMAVLSM
jgi:hypothetical protein